MLFFKNARPIAWMVWIIVSVFYAYQYVLRVMPSILFTDIMEQFHMSSADFGQFSGMYYIGYSLMHLPIGIMLDRFGPKKVIPICMMLTVIGLMPLLFSSHWAFPVAGRFLMGIGSSAAILGVFKIIRMSFSKDLFPRMLSFSVTIGVLGAICGGGPVSYLNETFGYLAVTKLFIALGVVLAIIAYFTIPKITSSEKGSFLSSVKEVMRNKQVILLCLFAGCMVGPLEGFADVWGAVFFKGVYGFEGTVAVSIPSLISIGMCFGSPLLTLFADKIGSYLKVIIGAGALMVVSFVSVLVWPLPLSILSVNVVLIGICCAYQILAIYKASTYVREEVSGTATAAANMIIMVFGYVFHAIIGSVVNVMGGAQDANALICGVSVIPVFLVLGSVGFIYLFIKEKSSSKTNLVEGGI